MDIKKIIEDKGYDVISTEESLKGIIPIEWDKEVIRGKRANMGSFFDDFDKYIEELSDEEFENVLIKAGIENCPLIDDKENKL